MSAPNVERLFVRIGEAARIVGVATHVIRFWETEFRGVRPQKSRSGQRVYSRNDVAKLQRIKALLYTDGFTIEGAKKKLREVGAPTLPGTCPTCGAVCAGPVMADRAEEST